MSTSFVDTSGIRLAYSEKNPGCGNLLFFIHGNSGSKMTWRLQFATDRLRNYHLIAFDLPGCGESYVSGIDGWDFSPINTGKVLGDAIKKLAGNTPFGLIGFSYGSNLVAEVLNYGLAPKAISLIAPCVVGKDFGIENIFIPGEYIFFQDDVEKGAVMSFFSNTLLSGNNVDIDIYSKDFFAVKSPFRSALIKSVGEGTLSDEIMALKGRDIPIQLIFGAEDKFLNINYLDSLPFSTWQNHIYKIPSAGHYAHADQAETVNKLLRDYFNDFLY